MFAIGFGFGYHQSVVSVRLCNNGKYFFVAKKQKYGICFDMEPVSDVSVVPTTAI